jgi:hypothetical protein
MNIIYQIPINLAYAPGIQIPVTASTLETFEYLHKLIPIAEPISSYPPSEFSSSYYCILQGSVSTIKKDLISPFAANCVRPPCVFNLRRTERSVRRTNTNSRHWAGGSSQSKAHNNGWTLFVKTRDDGCNNKTNENEFHQFLLDTARLTLIDDTLKVQAIVSTFQIRKTWERRKSEGALKWTFNGRLDHSCFAR